MLKKLFAGIAAVAILGVGGCLMQRDDGPTYRAGPVTVRRLSEQQYRNIVREVFGPNIEVGGRFPPEPRTRGLLAVGYGQVGATTAAVEQYASLADKIAEQVLSKDLRDELLPCKPENEKAPDPACARQFLEKVGLYLFRRPVAASTLDAYVSAADEATRQVADFYYGLSLALGAMLSSPQFLFREAVLKPDPEHAGKFRLDGYSRASQLSFLLWNSAPDPLLLAAASTGKLDTPEGLAEQIDRMTLSPRFQEGLRAFLVDFLRFDDLADMRKDTVLYPKFSAQVAVDAREQTLRTILDYQDKDYRDVFTARQTYLTRELGAIYQVPVPGSTPNGGPDTWQSFEFPAGDPRVGVLAHLSFTALHSHPGRSSPTLRGAALREIFMCQTVPPPPGNVKFDLVQNANGAERKTARDRLTAHRAIPTCAGCHKIMDPMGLALENFDGVGAFRTQENGAAIDTAGELDGVPFNDSAGLGRAMHDNSAVPTCLVNRMAAYAVGRPVTGGESKWVQTLRAGFIRRGYRFADLMKEIALTQAYSSLPPPQKIEKASSTLVVSVPPLPGPDSVSGPGGAP